MTLDITTGLAPLSAEERNGLYDKVVAPHYNAIRRMVKGQTFAGEDGEDILQDVLITLLLHVATIAALPPAQQLPWILRTVRNRLNDAHRHARLVNDTMRYDNDARSYDDDGSGHCAPQFSAGNLATDSGHCSTPALTIDRDDYPTTYDALMRLSPLQRRALLLASEGWSPADIMAELRLPATTVYAMLSRARNAVAAAVERRRTRGKVHCS